MLAVAKEQPNNIANLPKHAVHDRGDTKPPVPVSPHTYRQLETNACSLSCHYTVLLFCVAIAECTPLEGMTTFDSYRART